MDTEVCSTVEVQSSGCDLCTPVEMSVSVE